MLTDFISNQSSYLNILNLDWNYFSIASTEKLLTRIAECGVCTCLKEFNLIGSANFDSDESVRKLADILAITPILKKCNIEN